MPKEVFNAWFLQADQQHHPSSGRNLNCRPSALEGPIRGGKGLCLTNWNITETYIFFNRTYSLKSSFACTLSFDSHNQPVKNSLHFIFQMRIKKDKLFVQDHIAIDGLRSPTLNLGLFLLHRASVLFCTSK